MGFYTVGRRGTVTRPRYNARGACKRLYEGMKGFGTNEDAIIEVVGSHTVAQRQEIKTKYKIMYGKDLIKELDGELSGAFLKMVLALMKDPEEYILECIRNAIVKSRGDKLLKKMKKMTYKKGLCPDAYTLLGILCLRSNEELDEMKKAYKQKYETELEQDVGEDFSDEFKSLIFGIIYAGRDESSAIDLELVQEDIENLQGSAGGAGGTKEEHFQACLEERSWNHLRRLFNSYKDVTGEVMESFIEKSEVYSDVMKESYSTVVKIIRNESEFYAERLRDSIEGLGTDDETLISTIVLRSEIDLADIIMKYEVMFGTSLEDDVCGDTSGDYKNLILKLLTLPEEDSEEDEVSVKQVKKKVAAVEICTQTSMVENEEVVPMEDQKEETFVNAADERVEEAIGHEVEVEQEEAVEVEEEVEQENVDVLEESAPEGAPWEDEKVPQEEEEEEVGQTEEAGDAVEEEAGDAVEEEAEAPPAIEEVEPENAEAEVEGEEIQAAQVEKVVDGEESAPPTIEKVEADEVPEEKKTEDVDNADGG